MVFNIKKLLAGIAVAAAILVTGAANAATNWVTNSDTPGYLVQTARVDSATTPALLGKLKTVNPRKSVVVWFVGSTSPISMTIQTFTGTNGLGTQTATVGTTPVSVTYPAPVYFDGFKVSNTTALTGTNNVSVTAIQF